MIILSSNRCVILVTFPTIIAKERNELFFQNVKFLIGCTYSLYELSIEMSTYWVGILSDPTGQFPPSPAYKLIYCCQSRHFSKLIFPMCIYK